MFFIFDNLIATMVAGMVLLMIFTVQKRTTDTNLEQTALYMAKEHALGLGEWLQEDLGNVGAGIPLNQPFLETYEVEASTNNTKRFSFWRKMDASDITPTLITYELVEGEIAQVDGDPVQLYQVVRCTDSATCSPDSATLNGQSPPMLTYFRIDLLDENGGTWTAGTSSAYYLRVRFSTTSTLSTKQQHLRQAHWGTVLPLRQRGE